MIGLDDNLTSEAKRKRKGTSCPFVCLTGEMLRAERWILSIHLTLATLYDSSIVHMCVGNGDMWLQL